MADVFISIGSNVEPGRHVRAGVKALQRAFGQVTLSSVYESEPVGFAGTNFLNLVAQVQTTDSIETVQQLFKQIEDDHGRRRDGVKFSPRSLDLDLLLYDDCVQSGQGDLTPALPRAEIEFNAFVLWPLAEIAPHRVHPVNGKSYAQLWQAYERQQKLWAVEFDWSL